jgi:hypothetical protein
MTKPAFINTIKVEWDAKDPRAMILLEDVRFIDGHGKTWIATKDSRIDGASIPKLLWSLVGSPFIGMYRRASVIHDVYCVSRTEPWEKVHKMFYDAMITDGVLESKAKIIYKSIMEHGPKWDKNGKTITALDIGNIDKNYDLL